MALLDRSATAQTLVLPTKGPLNVRVSTYSYQDDEALGAYGEIEINFAVDDGAASAPFANADTASALLANINGVAAQIVASYSAVMGPLAQQAAIAGYAAALLSSAAASVAALPAVLLSGVSTTFAAAPSDAAGTAGTVSQALLSVSDNAVAQINPALVQTTPVSGITPAQAYPADPSLGLAALATWGATLPAPALYPATLATAQAAVVALVRQSAGVALAALYAQTSFSTAQAAQAARAQLGAVMDSVGAAIVKAGQVDMYRAWLALGALANRDIITRAQNLPRLATYSRRVSLPDVVLAQLLMQDGTQGDALAALNAAIHPLFMPTAGVWLQA